jgi:hypothetical protein
VLLGGGAAEELRALLSHGIGIHHAGILPRYKQLVEYLTLERLIKFVVSTETISAGINLPAKRVVFPSLAKFVRSQGRLVTAAEYHQMAGRAGRPQFDSEGIAIALAPEEVVQEMRKEIKDAQKRGYKVDEEKVRKAVYARARAEAQRRGDVVYDAAAHQALVKGEPAELKSQTRITAEQVLGIGLPDLTVKPVSPPPEAGAADADSPPESQPAYLDLNIVTVVDNLLLDDKRRREAQRRLAQVTDNLKALGVIDEHGRPVAGEMIGGLHGLDGLFIYYALMNHQLDYEELRQMAEFLVDHDAVSRILNRKELDKRKAWIRERLRERRMENPQVSWEDVEEEYDREFPRDLARIEVIHQEFCARLPHPELHGGKEFKAIWASIEEEQIDFLDFVARHDLAHEEGSLFSYLARVMKVCRTIHETTGIEQFATMAAKIRNYLSVIDARLIDSL